MKLNFWKEQNNIIALQHRILLIWSTLLACFIGSSLISALVIQYYYRDTIPILDESLQQSSNRSEELLALREQLESELKILETPAEKELLPQMKDFICDMARYLPKNVWLEEIHSEKNQPVEITGIFQSYADFHSFLQAIPSSPWVFQNSRIEQQCNESYGFHVSYRFFRLEPIS